MIDEEINLAPTRSGSAKRIRAGHKRAMQAISREQAAKKPLWIQQLHNYNGKKKKK